MVMSALRALVQDTTQDIGHETSAGQEVAASLPQRWNYICHGLVYTMSTPEKKQSKNPETSFFFFFNY